MVNMNSFETAVKATADIADSYEKGLGALGSDSKYVAIEKKETRLIDGSVDIDNSTKDRYPDDERWDYVISFKGKAFFMEIHPATAGEVKKMEGKLKWLMQWLKQNAPLLDQYPQGKPRFSWIHSGKGGLPKTAPEYRRAALMGIPPVNLLVLS